MIAKELLIKNDDSDSLIIRMKMKSRTRCGDGRRKRGIRGERKGGTKIRTGTR